MNCESEAKKETETAAAEGEGEGEGQEQEGEHRREETEEVKLYKYIGETCRSVWERATEHLADLKNLSPASHLLKHILDKHEGQSIEDIKFGIRVVKYTRAAFERQILESVKIQQERQHHHLLNARAKYNCCSLPRLSSKIGEQDYKRWEKESEEEKLKEDLIKEKIVRMKNNQNRERQE